MDIKRFIAESDRIGFAQFTCEDDPNMLISWQNLDGKTGYNYAINGSLADLNSIDISACPYWVAAVNKASSEKVGVLRLSISEDLDLAIWIDPNYRAKGYGTEALSLAVKHIFRSTNLRKICASCHCDNKVGLRMLEKVGFTRYPAEDQHEENVFCGEPTTQLRFVMTNAIETKDLILRQGSSDDWQDLYRNLWSRENVFRYMFSNPSPDCEAGRQRTALYSQMHQEVKTEFFVCEKVSGQVIGIAGTKELKPGKWTITDIAIGPDFHSKGYGKQIVTALMNLAINQGAKAVAYDCFRQNTISKKLALSCGFVYTHSEESELMKNGKKVILDYYIYEDS